MIFVGNLSCDVFTTSNIDNSVRSIKHIPISISLDNGYFGGCADVDSSVALHQTQVTAAIDVADGADGIVDGACEGRDTLRDSLYIWDILKFVGESY